MLEGDSADMCAAKFLLMLTRGLLEGSCVQEARTPNIMIGNSMNKFGFKINWKIQKLSRIDLQY